MKIFGLLLASALAKLNLDKRDRAVDMLEGRRKEKLYYEESNGKKLKDKDKYDGEDLIFRDDEREFGLPDDFDSEHDYDAKIDGWDGWFQNFNWTQYIDGDDIAEEFFNRPNMLRSPMTLKERLEYRKFKMLKLMVMYLQSIPLFGKFCYYGCYCFPNVGQDFTVGKGKPVDEVDKKCRDFSNCYKCLNIDYKGTCKHTQPYSFEGRQDPVTQKKYVVCKNKPGTCRRALCECDKRLTEQLSESEWYWVPLYHKNWGGFDKKQWCSKDANPEKSESVDRAVAVKVDPVYRCCGKYPDRVPYQYTTSYGEDRRCCAGKTYDPNFLDCCPNPENPATRLVKTIGTCNA